MSQEPSWSQVFATAIAWGVLIGLTICLGGMLCNCVLEVEIPDIPDIDVNVTAEFDPCFTCFPECTEDGAPMCVDDKGADCVLCKVGCLFADAPSGISCSADREPRCANSGVRVPAVCVTAAE